MSTTVKTRQTSTGFIDLRHRASAIVNDPDFVAVVLFSADVTGVTESASPGAVLSGP